MKIAPNLQAKADAIVANFGAIKVLAYFSKKSVMKRLKEELSGHTTEEVGLMYDYLATKLCESDLRLLVDFISQAGKGSLK